MAQETVWHSTEATIVRDSESGVEAIVAPATAVARATGSPIFVIASGGDDTDALQTAVDTALPTQPVYIAGRLLTSATVTIDRPVRIVGVGASVGFTLGMSLTAHSEIRKTNGDTGGDAVLEYAEGSEGAALENVVVTCATAGTILYTSASLPAGASGNTAYGIKVADTVAGLRFARVGVQQARVAGLQTGGATHKFLDCVTFACYAGHVNTATDSALAGALYHHNVTDGLVSDGNYLRISDSRFEWNAQHGALVTSGENQFTGNLFDRNGYSGIYLNAQWGHTGAGNYFSRNGASGDGSVGRWDFSVPGHASYLETPAEEKSHIRMTYMRDVAFTGNRYRAGRDDSNAGALSPAYVYTGNNVVGCRAVGNVGESVLSGGVGGAVTGVETLVNSSQATLVA